MSRQWWIVLAAFFLAACGNGEQVSPTVVEGSAETAGQAAGAKAPPSPYELAVANESRPEADQLRDSSRKPAEILEFFNVTEGMRVLDMFSGGGYYTEILSYLVGPDGKVFAQNNQAYLEILNYLIDHKLLLALQSHPHQNHHRHRQNLLQSLHR